MLKFTSNKKEILFYTDRAYNLQVNPGNSFEWHKRHWSGCATVDFSLVFVESWRKVSVEGLDEKKIAEFLDTHGHRALANNVPRMMVSGTTWDRWTRSIPLFLQFPTKTSKRGARRQDVLKSNHHVASQLVVNLRHTRPASFSESHFLSRIIHTSLTKNNAHGSSLRRFLFLSLFMNLENRWEYRVKFKPRDLSPVSFSAINLD